MTQYQLEVQIGETRNRYAALMQEKMQVIRQNKVRRLELEKQVSDIRKENNLLQGDVEQLKIRMNDELTPLIRLHADLRAQNEAENKED
ncbi:MAG: hypothetical protein IJ838_00190 [Paludibacteraceae bacterium]|nr:hypothetical protein [Paludibacteraceae bacterium]